MENSIKPKRTIGNVLNKKILVSAITFLLIGVLLGSFISYSATPSSTFYLFGGIYPGAPSYTIWTDSAFYYAKNINGFMAYSGTNLSLIFQEMIDSLAPEGGKIYFAGGDFIFTNTVSLKSGDFIQGEAIGYTGSKGTNIATRFYLADDSDCVLINCAGEKGDGFTYPYTIKDLWIYGNRDAQTVNCTLLDFTDGQLGVIDNLAIFNAGEYGLKARRARITNCYFADNGWGGIYSITDNFIATNEFAGNVASYASGNGQITAPGGYDVVTNNIIYQGLGWGINTYGAVGMIISNNRIDGENKAGIYLAYGSNHTVIGNQILSCSKYGLSSYPGVLVQNIEYSVISLNRIGNIASYSDHFQKCGIQETGTSDYNTYIGNDVHGNVAETILLLGVHSQAHLFYNATVWIS